MALGVGILFFLWVGGRALCVRRPASPDARAGSSVRVYASGWAHMLAAFFFVGFAWMSWLALTLTRWPGQLAAAAMASLYAVIALAFERHVLAVVELRGGTLTRALPGLAARAWEVSDLQSIAFSDASPADVSVRLTFTDGSALTVVPGLYNTDELVRRLVLSASPDVIAGVPGPAGDQVRRWRASQRGS